MICCAMRRRRIVGAWFAQVLCELLSTRFQAHFAVSPTTKIADTLECSGVDKRAYACCDDLAADRKRTSFASHLGAADNPRDLAPILDEILKDQCIQVRDRH
jgi:hypothetical protein